MPDAEDRSLPFTLRQRRSLLLVFSLVTVYIAFLAYCDRQYVPDPLPNELSLASRLADRIDPNTADVATLAALPGLGEKRARLMIAFREKSQQRAPGTTAFQSPYDLLKVRGIGIAMVDNLRPYLIFPDPTTQPAPQSRDYPKHRGEGRSASVQIFVRRGPQRPTIPDLRERFLCPISKL